MHHSKQITQLFQAGSFWRKGAYKFKYIKKEKGPLEVVISISKRVGNSPKRNQLKRLFREAIRTNAQFKTSSYEVAVFITNPLEQPPSLKKLQEIMCEFFDYLYENENQQNT